MPRPRAAEPRTAQLLLRISARQMEVLGAVAHLERVTPNAYAHQVLVVHLASMVKNARVQTDLANRAAYEADATATTPLAGRSKRPPVSNKGRGPAGRDSGVS